MKTLTLLLTLVSCAFAQTTTAGSTTTAGTTLFSASTPAPFNALTLSTENGFAPSTALLTGFPTVAGGGAAEGYQGGIYTNGMALYTPWQVGSATPHGTLLAYTGGSGGTFHCTNPTTCAANWDFFNMATGVTLACPGGATCPTSPADTATGYTCGVVTDSAGIVYFIPGVDNQTPAMMSFNPFGSNGAGGSPVSNSANYAGFDAPTKNTSTLGYKYGWCTGVYDGRYVYFAPTAGGTAFSNSNFLRYDTQPLGSPDWPSGFVLANFSAVNLSSASFLNDANACCFLSSSYDGGQNIYLLPINNNGRLVIYNKTLSFTTGSSYKEFLMANLGTGGSYPHVTGNGNLNALQNSSGFVGGQMVWNAAGSIEYMYLAPFATNPGGIAQAGQILQSTVVRVKVATCGSPSAGSQTCSGGFAAVDITASTSTWEIFDLANLAVNQEWSIAGYASPALYGPVSSYGNNSLANQLILGGFQLTWLNVHNTADPIVGFVADFGYMYARQHVNGSLSDPSSWDLVPRPSTQANGCMGGGYDPVNQLFYTACPGANPVPSAWQIGPL
jgi:hypothetical protein